MFRVYYAFKIQAVSGFEIVRKDECSPYNKTVVPTAVPKQKTPAESFAL